MSKLKELIRLHKEQVSNRKIGRMLGMDKKTVGKYVKLVDKDPIGPDGLLKLEDPVLEHRYTGGNAAYSEKCFQDLAGRLEYITKELGKTGVTMCLLWEEYRKDFLEIRKTRDITLGEGMEMMLQSERDKRRESRIARLLKNARFRYEASIERIILDKAKGRDKDRIMQLSTCDYLKTGASVLISGPTGVGKSYLATALGRQACMYGYKVNYYNMQKLSEAINMARIESSISKFFDKLSGINLLIVDDFGLVKLSGQQLIDFMEIIEDRHTRKSTIIASQLPISDWYDVLAKNKTIADSIIDRIVKTSYRFELKGDSLRK